MSAAGGCAVDSQDGGVETGDDDVAASVVIDARIRNVTVDIEWADRVRPIKRHGDTVRINATKAQRVVRVVTVIGQRDPAGEVGVEAVIHTTRNAPAVEVEPELSCRSRP